MPYYEVVRCGTRNLWLSLEGIVACNDISMHVISIQQVRAVATDRAKWTCDEPIMPSPPLVALLILTPVLMPPVLSAMDERALLELGGLIHFCRKSLVKMLAGRMAQREQLARNIEKQSAPRDYDGWVEP